MRGPSANRRPVNETTQRFACKTKTAPNISLILIYAILFLATCASAFCLAEQEQTATRSGAMTPKENTHTGPAWWDDMVHTVDGKRFTVITLSGDPKDLPPGLEQMPQKGHAVLSPGAETLMGELNLPDDYFGEPAGTVAADKLSTPNAPLVYRSTSKQSASATPFETFGTADSTTAINYDFSLESTIGAAAGPLIMLLLCILCGSAFSLANLATSNYAMRAYMGTERSPSFRGIFPSSLLNGFINTSLASIPVCFFYTIATFRGFDIFGHSILANDFRGGANSVALILVVAVMLVSIIEATFVTLFEIHYFSTILQHASWNTPRKTVSNKLIWFVVVSTIGVWLGPGLFDAEWRFLVFLAFLAINLLSVSFLIYFATTTLYDFWLSFKPPAENARRTDSRRMVTRRVGIFGLMLVALCTVTSILIVSSNLSNGLSIDTVKMRTDAWDQLAVAKNAPNGWDAVPISSFDDPNSHIFESTGIDDGGSVEVRASQRAWEVVGLSCSQRCRLDINDLPEGSPLLLWLLSLDGEFDNLVQISGPLSLESDDLALVGDSDVTRSRDSLNHTLFAGGATSGFFESLDSNARAGVYDADARSELISHLSFISSFILASFTMLSVFVYAPRRSSANESDGLRRYSMTTRLFDLAGVYMLMLAVATAGIAYCFLLPGRLGQIVETDSPDPFVFVGFWVSVLIGISAVFVVQISFMALRSHLRRICSKSKFRPAS